MEGPAKRRATTVHAFAELGVSQRRACHVLDESRFSVRRGEPAVCSADEVLRLRRQLRQLAQARPWLDYRRLCALRRAEGHQVNHNRVARLCREEGLRVRGNTGKRRRVSTSTGPARHLAAQRRDHVCALEYQFDATTNGRQITLLNVVDEFTHESIADTLARSLNADTPVAILESVIAVRGITPSFIRTEKGSELTAASLRERCRFTGTSYIKSGVPCKTCYI